MTEQERKAMEMALPLLVAYQDYTGDSRIANKCGEAIEALRQALAQPNAGEGVDGSVRVFVKRDGEWERVDSYEQALTTLEDIYWGKP